ncbi:MAG: hypothetical protein L6Q34_13385 [Nitrospira sp.]|nr:hypothetical protein [Nitrospira sp. NTP2]MCK6494411.1 hypothetical protein [Nitrospira sp.]MCK6498532.1 hypothetical protein [Nitrospira sp.]RIK58983.1 MAG: hypothetical protein DCC63_08570 [Nitrospira sp.]
MEITLDDETWQLSDAVPIADVLASISDRAHAKHRLVTTLTIGGRPISDRDLTPVFLNQRVEGFGAIRATSQSLQSIISDARRAIALFGNQLRDEGLVLLPPLRSGLGQVGVVDLWLGRLADYMEMLDAGQARRVEGLSSAPLLPWVQEILDARGCADPIRMADLLEYELLPRLQTDGAAV